MDTTLARAQALEFVKLNKSGVIATVNKDAQPHAATVFYIVDDNFNIYFTTLGSSRKFEAIQSNPKVAFVVSRQDLPRTLQIEGLVEEVTPETYEKASVPNLLSVLSANGAFYPPITQMDGGPVTVMRIKPTWIRWADYSQNKTGNHEVWAEIPLA